MIFSGFRVWFIVINSFDLIAQVVESPSSHLGSLLFDRKVTETFPVQLSSGTGRQAILCRDEYFVADFDC